MDEEGFLPDEDAWPRWRDALVAAFDASPEARGGPRSDGLWIEHFVDLLRNYEGVSLAHAEPYMVDSVVLDLFPRKLMAEPGDAAGAVAELRAFFSFVARAFDAPHAPQCVEMLDDEFAAQLRDNLGDRSSWGMAKSLFSLGREAGFEMHSQESVDRFVESYNAQLGGGGARAPGSPKTLQKASRAAQQKKKSKSKRKAAKKARRKNR